MFALNVQTSIISEVNEAKLILQTVNYLRNSVWKFGRKVQNHYDSNAFGVFFAAPCICIPISQGCGVCGVLNYCGSLTSTLGLTVWHTDCVLKDDCSNYMCGNKVAWRQDGSETDHRVQLLFLQEPPNYWNTSQTLGIRELLLLPKCYGWKWFYRQTDAGGQDTLEVAQPARTVHEAGRNRPVLGSIYNQGVVFVPGIWVSFTGRLRLYTHARS